MFQYTTQQIRVGKQTRGRNWVNQVYGYSYTLVRVRIYSLMYSVLSYLRTFTILLLLCFTASAFILYHLHNVMGVVFVTVERMIYSEDVKQTISLYTSSKATMIAKMLRGDVMVRRYTRGIYDVRYML